MSSKLNVFHKLTGLHPQYGMGTYGIEVEAERFPDHELECIREGVSFEHEALRALGRYWRATTDGSLRHNGVEWISQPLVYDVAVRACEMLYTAMREGLFRPSVRSGIHVHVNIAPLVGAQIVERMRAYAVLEPMLFRFVGVEREQNIYCVPIYRAENEQALWQELSRNLALERPTRDELALTIRDFRSCCKYSALNLGSFLRLGTMEFRHAPTFPTFGEMRAWLGLVELASTFELPPDATIDALEAARERALALFPRLDWAAYVEEVRSRGLVEFANSLLPYTYKVAEWGKPAGLAFDAKLPTYQRVAPSGPRIRLPEREDVDEYHDDVPEPVMVEQGTMVFDNSTTLTLTDLLNARRAMNQQEVR